MTKNKIYDLRSDTAVLPDEDTRKLIAEVPLGNDDFGEDPATNELEKLAAKEMGMDSGVFMASGTMGNIVAIMTHLSPGEAMFLGRLSHIVLFEHGGVARLAGVTTLTVNDSQGRPDLNEIKHQMDQVANIRPGLIALENTHNAAGGLCIDRKGMRSYIDFCRKWKLLLHVDGARIYHASIALSTTPANLLKGVDSVTFCLSKCMAAPAGAVLCGTDAFIARARQIRKMLGGGMRHPGVLTIAGIKGIKNIRNIVKNDHALAQRLAKALRRITGIKFSPKRVETNMMMIDTEVFKMSSKKMAGLLEKRGVLTSPFSSNRLRFITHGDLTFNDIDEVASIVADTLS